MLLTAAVMWISGYCLRMVLMTSSFMAIPSSEVQSISTRGSDVHAAGFDAVLFRLGHQVVEYPQTVSGGFGNTGIIAAQSNHFPLGVGDSREDLVNLVPLHRYGVDQAGRLQ